MKHLPSSGPLKHLVLDVKRRNGYSPSGGVIAWMIVDFRSGMSVVLDMTFVDIDIYLAQLCLLERPGLRTE